MSNKVGILGTSLSAATDIAWGLEEMGSQEPSLVIQSSIYHPAFLPSGLRFASCWEALDKLFDGGAESWGLSLTHQVYIRLAWRSPTLFSVWVQYLSQIVANFCGHLPTQSSLYELRWVTSPSQLTKTPLGGFLSISSSRTWPVFTIPLAAWRCSPENSLIHSFKMHKRMSHNEAQLEFTKKMLDWAW